MDKICHKTFLIQLQYAFIINRSSTKEYNGASNLDTYFPQLHFNIKCNKHSVHTFIQVECIFRSTFA